MGHSRQAAVYAIVQILMAVTVEVCESGKVYCTSGSLTLDTCAAPTVLQCYNYFIDNNNTSVTFTATVKYGYIILPKVCDSFIFPC